MSQVDVGDDDEDHRITPEERLRAAMTRQKPSHDDVALIQCHKVPIRAPYRRSIIRREALTMPVGNGPYRSAG